MVEFQAKDLNESADALVQDMARGLSSERAQAAAGILVARSLIAILQRLDKALVILEEYGK
jgi:hypothetical protein